MKYFIKLFRRVAGQTPHAYLSHCRIDQAKRLLESPELQVKTIAARVGFRDQHYFAKAFARHTGQTPTQYRRCALARRGVKD